MRNNDEIVTPKEFECLITHQNMVDPVIPKTGQTYEKEAIEDWLKGK